MSSIVIVGKILANANVSAEQNVRSYLHSSHTRIQWLLLSTAKL